MIAKAKDRFTLLGYGYDERPRYGLSEPHIYSDRWTIYVCPSCRAETGFEWPDFHKHIGSRFSNLTFPDQRAVEREAASSLNDENGFVDFYCHGCNGVVRTYYRYNPPEERQSDWLELRMVVELSVSVAKPC
jgi:hypothetical protein